MYYFFSLTYLGDNVRNALNLLDFMVEHSVGNIVLSSTANLFDQPEHMPISESERAVPGSPFAYFHFFPTSNGQRTIPSARPFTV